MREVERCARRSCARRCRRRWWCAPSRRRARAGDEGIVAGTCGRREAPPPQEGEPRQRGRRGLIDRPRRGVRTPAGRNRRWEAGGGPPGTRSRGCAGRRAWPPRRPAGATGGEPLAMAGTASRPCCRPIQPTTATVATEAAAAKAIRPAFSGAAVWARTVGSSSRAAMIRGVAEAPPQGRRPAARPRSGGTPATSASVPRCRNTDGWPARPRGPRARRPSARIVPVS